MSLHSLAFDGAQWAQGDCANCQRSGLEVVNIVSVKIVKRSQDRLIFKIDYVSFSNDNFYITAAMLT